MPWAVARGMEPAADPSSLFPYSFSLNNGKTKKTLPKNWGITFRSNFSKLFWQTFQNLMLSLLLRCFLAAALPEIFWHSDYVNSYVPTLMYECAGTPLSCPFSDTEEEERGNIYCSQMFYQKMCISKLRYFGVLGGLIFFFFFFNQTTEEKLWIFFLVLSCILFW